MPSQSLSTRTTRAPTYLLAITCLSVSRSRLRNTPGARRRRHARPMKERAWNAKSEWSSAPFTDSKGTQVGER